MMNYTIFLLFKFSEPDYDVISRMLSKLQPLSLEKTGYSEVIFLNYIVFPIKYF